VEVWSELHSRRNQRCTRFHGLNGIYRVASVTARGFFGRFYQKEKKHEMVSASAFEVR
jgi:hypothetical protein